MDIKIKKEIDKYNAIKAIDFIYDFIQEYADDIYLSTNYSFKTYMFDEIEHYIRKFCEEYE